MNKTQRFKEYIKSEYDIDYVGIAKASALDSEPQYHRPQDVLPGAKTIVVLVRRIVDGAIQSLFRTYENKQTAAQSSYAAYASNNAANFMLVDATVNIAGDIEEDFGAVAVPLPFNIQQSTLPEKYLGAIWSDPYGQGLPIDIFKAAWAAGLGEFGWNNRFMTPQDGPRVLVSAILTTMDFDTDEPYSGPKLCDPEKCGICAKICPTQAIKEAAKQISINGAFQKVSDLNINSCNIAEMAMRKQFMGRVPVPDQILGNEATDEEFIEAFKKKPMDPLHVDHYPRYMCDRCLVYCPVGNWKERFRDTNQSSFDPDTGKFDENVKKYGTLNNM